MSNCFENGLLDLYHGKHFCMLSAVQQLFKISLHPSQLAGPGAKIYLKKDTTCSKKHFTNPIIYVLTEPSAGVINEAGVTFPANKTLSSIRLIGALHRKCEHLPTERQEGVCGELSSRYSLSVNP